MGVFIPVHSICSILNPVLCNILPAAHAITRCDSTSSLFVIGKRTVFKVLKDSPENFRDLSTLADCDTDKSIDAASKLVCRLYDQKGKLKEDHVDLNKLRVRLATLRDACLAKLPPCEATFTQHVFAILTTDKYLDDCPCCKTANEVYSAIWMGRQEWISSSLFQRPDVF